MRPNERFLRKPKSFWASVRTLSQHVGYSKGDTIIVPSPSQMVRAFRELGLDDTKLVHRGAPTPLAVELGAYFQERSNLLVKHVEPRLMDAERAKEVFKEMYALKTAVSDTDE